MRSYILFFFSVTLRTCDINYHLTIELDHAKRDSRLTAYGGVVLQRLEGFEFIKVCMGTVKSILLIFCEKNLPTLLLCWVFCCLPAPQADLTQFRRVIVWWASTARGIEW